MEANKTQQLRIENILFNYDNGLLPNRQNMENFNNWIEKNLKP